MSGLPTADSYQLTAESPKGQPTAIHPVGLHHWTTFRPHGDFAPALKRIEEISPQATRNVEDRFRNFAATQEPVLVGIPDYFSRQGPEVHPWATDRDPFATETAGDVSGPWDAQHLHGDWVRIAMLYRMSPATRSQVRLVPVEMQGDSPMDERKLDRAITEASERIGRPFDAINASYGGNRLEYNDLISAGLKITPSTVDQNGAAIQKFLETREARLANQTSIDGNRTRSERSIVEQQRHKDQVKAAHDARFVDQLSQDSLTFFAAGNVASEINPFTIYHGDTPEDDLGVPGSQVISVGGNVPRTAKGVVPSPYANIDELARIGATGSYNNSVDLDYSATHSTYELSRAPNGQWSARILEDQGWPVPMEELRLEGEQPSSLESWLTTHLERAELASHEQYRKANETGIMHSNYLYDPRRIPALEHLLRGTAWRPGQFVPGVNLNEWTKADEYCRVEVKDGKAHRVLLGQTGSSFAAPAALGRSLEALRQRALTVGDSH